MEARTTIDLDPILDAISAAIGQTEALPTSNPIVSRARAHALALLWAAHDEVESSLAVSCALVAWDGREAARP